MPLSIPTGPYQVSTRTLEVPVRYPKSFGNSLLGPKHTTTSRSLFHLDTVLFTLFYPTSLSKTGSTHGSGLSWLNEPRLKSIEGLLKYGNLSRYFVYPAAFFTPFFTKLPYSVDGPLAAERAASETPASSAKRTAFPVAVFSHGLAGTRTTYSQYLSELASHGTIVASVEHRDGSCPYTSVRTEAEQFDLMYTKYQDLEIDPQSAQEKPSVWDMRKWQLQLRQSEIEEVVYILHEINDGRGNEVMKTSTRKPTGEQMNDWKDSLDLGNLWALGHSFGGATAIEMLRQEDTIFTHALVLDPWVEPIAKAGHGPSIRKPLYVINSEAFTVWRTHFKQVRDVVAEAKTNTGQGWLISLTKTKHTDFSDFPFVMPRFFRPATGNRPLDTLLVFVKASLMQMSDSFDKLQLGMPIREEVQDEVEKEDLGQGGNIVWHPIQISSAVDRTHL